MTDLDLTSTGGSCRFTGSLELNKPKHLRIAGNSISDLIVKDSSLLADCDISDNPMLYQNTHILNLGT